MSAYGRHVSILFTAAFALSPAWAFAQGVSDEQTVPDEDTDRADANENEEEMAPAEGSAENLPPSRSDSDPLPPVARPDIPSGGVVQQAGIGGSVGYGRAGVLELGGSAGFMSASNFNSVSINPSIGWFFADNVQISAILGFSYQSAEGQDATMFSLLLEPSYHLPFSRSMFGFLGFGIGGAHVNDAGFGFAIAPRIGANFLVGRSGILTPSLSYQYTTHDTMDTNDGRSFMAVSTALAANVGYTVMW